MHPKTRNAVVLPMLFTKRQIPNGIDDLTLKKISSKVKRDLLYARSHVLLTPFTDRLGIIDSTETFNALEGFGPANNRFRIKFKN